MHTVLRISRCEACGEYDCPAHVGLDDIGPKLYNLWRAHMLARRGMLKTFLSGRDVAARVEVVHVRRARVTKSPAPKKP